jgi:hypothetical protein
MGKIEQQPTQTVKAGTQLPGQKPPNSDTLPSTVRYLNDQNPDNLQQTYITEKQHQQPTHNKRQMIKSIRKYSIANSAKLWWYRLTT